MDNEKITDKDAYIEQLKYAATGSECTFNMLRDILTKFFPILFYLNGGAAIAILAFLGNLVEYNDKYLLGLLNSLGCFAFGALFTAVSLGVAYVAQCYYQEYAETCWNDAWNREKLNSYKPEKTKFFKKGKYCRLAAMILAGISGGCFVAGCIVFICTFRCY